MPPRRFIALIPLLMFLLGLLIIVQQNHLSFIPALAQMAPEDLPIDLIVTSDSPIDSPKMAGTTVTLTATVVSGSGAGLTYFWNFGDGQTAEGRVVQHVYAAEGIYSPFVIATNGADSKRATTIVRILPFDPLPPPEEPIEGLKATSDSPVIAGNPVTFLGTVVKGTNVIYTWNFGDGSPPATGPSVSHVYPTPGYYFVTLHAESRFGPATDSTQVVITDAPPKGLRIAHTNPLAVNSAAFFTSTIESGTNVQYQWSLSDGKLFNGPRFIHLFDKTATLEVRVRAWNSAGEISASEMVTVQDQPPVILRVFDDSPKSVKQAIFFLAQIQSNSPVVAYWQWGDGKVTEVRSRDDQADLSIKEINSVHDYEFKDKYIVTLVVYNLGGSVTSELIAYADTNKPSSSLPISWTPVMPVFGRAITFSVPLNADLYTCIWDFDDGTPPVTGKPVIEYTYTRANSYVVHAQCFTQDRTQITDADRIIHVGTTLFMPILASNGAFVIEAPTATPTATPTDLPGGANSEPTATATLTPTATATLIPPVASTPTPTEVATLVPDPPTPTLVPTLTPTPVATPTELPPTTPTPTATFAPGGTIPQATPTPTETTLGGTIPQSSPP